MLWLYYFFFEIFIWSPHIRDFITASHPIVHLAASFLNDMIWLPIALALPFYSIDLIRRIFRRLILRDGFIFLFAIGWILTLASIDVFFRFQFLFILFFLTLWGVHIFQTRTISMRTCYYVLALLGMLVHYNSQLLPHPAPRRSHMTVMTFNVNTKTAYDDERTVQFVRQRVPDIVFLQELSGHEQRLITTRLRDLYPYMLSPARGYGKNDVMILSRKKILYADHIPLKTSWRKGYHSINHAVVESQGQKIHLLNCHLYHACKELAAYIENPDSALYEALTASYLEQQEQARLLHDYMRALNGPIILAGDFNDTPNSMIYKMFQDCCQNAFATAGWGLGTTFGEWVMRKNLPRPLRALAFDMLRIDHLFFSHHFIIKSATVEKLSAFDHHPHMVTAILKERENEL